MPRCVIDIDLHMYIIGQRYYCGDPRCKKTYQSWSQSILDAIPVSLASQCPFHLTFQSGLTDQLAALVWSSFGRGLGPSPFADMIQTLHLCWFELHHAQYLEMVELRLPYVSLGFLHFMSLLVHGVILMAMQGLYPHIHTSTVSTTAY